MVAATKTILVKPDSDLARWLDEAGDGPLGLIKDGARFRVIRETTEAEAGPVDPWASYDPEKVRHALREAAGSITEDEAERMKAYIYAAREVGTRAPDRP